MRIERRTWRSPRLAVAIAVLVVPGLGVAGEGVRKIGPYHPEDATVEMFEGIESGQIDVTIIPKDSTESNVLIENKSDKPLNVKLPDAFAGVPVLAQLGGGGFGGGGLGGGGFGGGGQGVGGGFGGGGLGGGGLGGGGGMGMFNVPPEKVGKMKVITVCLEHGKPEPRPAMKYKIVPIAEFTDQPAVHELCRMLATGRINQRAAQVAAWHLNDGMSLQELAAKRIERANGASYPYFSPQELRAGVQIVAMAQKMAEERAAQAGSSETASAR